MAERYYTEGYLSALRCGEQKAIGVEPRISLLALCRLSILPRQHFQQFNLKNQI
jgi:hypothetical protein